MYLLPHALFGAALAYLFGWWGVLLAFISHFLLDAVVHSHYSKSIKHHALVVLLTILAVSELFIIKKDSFIILGAIAASIPDIDDIFLVLFKSKNKILMKYVKFHGKIHSETTKIIGGITQLATILLSLALFLL